MCRTAAGRTGPCDPAAGLRAGDQNPVSGSCDASGNGDRRAGPNGHAGKAGSAIEDFPGARVGAGWGDVPDLELQRLEAAERTAGEAGDHVDPVTLREGECEVRPTERDAVDDVAFTPQHELGVATGRGPDPLHCEPEDGDERLGVPGTARGQTCEIPVQRVIDIGGRQREIDGQRARDRRVLRRPTARKRPTNSSHRSTGSSKPAAAA